MDMLIPDESHLDCSYNTCEKTTYQKIVPMHFYEVLTAKENLEIKE